MTPTTLELVEEAAPDDELSVITLVPIGMSVVEITVELAGQLGAPGVQEVMVVRPVL